MKRLVVDMSSVCWTCLMAGKDKENGVEVLHEGKSVWVNSADFGYENAMNMISSTMTETKIVPSNVILVVEGAYSKDLRRHMLPDYKGSKDNRTPEHYEQFNLLKQKLSESLLNVGARTVTQDGVEADDIIAYLSAYLEGEVYILSNDGDMLQLVNERVHVIRNGETDRNKYGPFDFRHIHLYKSLVGDASDKIPGAKGFGEAAFLDLVAIFGDEGLDALEDLIKRRKLDALVEDVSEMKKLQLIINNADTVYDSYAASDLYPNKVNTLRRPLAWKFGMVKPLAEVWDERLKPYAGRVRLIHQDNYAEALAWAAPHIKASPFVALDIETSTPQESDDWLAQVQGVGPESGKDLGVDVFGSELTGMALTFGNNGQYTLYLTHDHLEEPGIKNLTVDQCRQFVEMVPRGVPFAIQNVSFELPILYTTWGEHWKDDPEFHGFIPNAHDTKIMASYVNENLSSGLKQSSKHYLDYSQVSYSEVTTVKFSPFETPWPGGKPLGASEDGELTVQYKMREMPATHVLSYGADDTICTAALYTHYRILMEIEKSWQVFLDVEVLPAYVTALAFHQGTPISSETINDMARDDDAAFAEAWATVRDYLVKNGWEGTVCPTYNEMTPAAIKEAAELFTGKEFSTRKRKLEGIAADLEVWFKDVVNEPGCASVNFIEAVAAADLSTLNSLVISRFTGEPVLDIDSPKKMQVLLYDVMEMPPRILNKPTDKMREDNPQLAAAFSRWNRIRNGSKSEEPLTDDEMTLLRTRAKTDDTAIESALAFDADILGEEKVAVLKAISVMKTVQTRRKLFYVPYKHIKHWKDNLVHAQVNQCAAVTRRYSASKPNLQQLPKKGEGIRFREAFIPHKSNAVVVSIDFDGQELRLAAERSQDKNLLACYVGPEEKRKKMHNLTAAGGMRLKWGAKVVEDYMQRFGSDLSGEDAEYHLFIRLTKEPETHSRAQDLYKQAKNVNFAAQFGAMAPKIAETLIMPLEDASNLLTARSQMFPDVDAAAERAAEHVRSQGYAETMLGVRRHLSHVVNGDDKWEIERACRQGWNMEIQGSAAEMTKLAMARLWKSGALHKFDVRFIAPIHDELVASVVAEDAADFLEVMHGCMTAPYAKMAVPIMGSISVGINFGQQHEMGLEVDKDAIRSKVLEITGA